MKIRISKTLLRDLPAPVSAVVSDWRRRCRKAFISVDDVRQFYINEDARYVAFSTDLRTSKLIRASGEFAGLTELLPGSNCPLRQDASSLPMEYF